MSDTLTDEQVKALHKVYWLNNTYAKGLNSLTLGELNAIRAVAEAAMAMEREACAIAAEVFTEVPEVICSDVPIDIAAAIRKRGETK